LPKTVGRVVG